MISKTQTDKPKLQNLKNIPYQRIYLGSILEVKEMGFDLNINPNLREQKASFNIFPTAKEWYCSYECR